MVLIFSSPSSSTNASKAEKTSSSRVTSSAGVIAEDIGVKSTTSVNSTDAEGTSSAIVACDPFNLAAISSGRMLCSRSSDRRWNRSRCATK